MRCIVPIVVCFIVLVLGVLIYKGLLQEAKENWELERSALAAKIIIDAETRYVEDYEKEPVKAQEALLRYLAAQNAASIIDPLWETELHEEYGSIKLFLLNRRQGLKVGEQHYFEIAMQNCKDSGWSECGEDRFERHAAFYECAFIRNKGLSEECHRLLRSTK